MKKAVRTLSMFALFVLAATLLLSSRTFADTIDLSLNAPAQPGTAGSTVSFAATVSAPGTNGGTVFFNGDGFNVSSPLLLDDSGFFFDFPLSLDPGESFSGPLFSIALPSNLAAGLYTGSFEILGGAHSGALDTLGSVNFQVNVAPSTVPEPESLMLLAAGLPGMAFLVQKKWRRSSDSKA
ncbi:MAG: sorting protein [Edaphobacter sp.]|nr:sorting protein [Edaphobacter sp.]